jgi:O-antigen ligase
MQGSLAFYKRPLFWWDALKWFLITLGVAVGLFFAVVGFNLAFGLPGCHFMWNMLAAWCGSHTGMALAASIYVFPIALFFAIRRPWIFPVALYALMVPSDSYLNFTQLTGGSSLTKIAAILATMAILFKLFRAKKFVNPGGAPLAWTVYAIWCSMTILWAFNPNEDVISWWFTLLQLVAFYVVLVVAPIDEQDFRIVFNSFIVGAMFASLFGAYTFGVGGHKIVNEGRLKAYFNPDNKLVSDLFSASFVFPIAIVTMNTLRTKWGLKKFGMIFVWSILLVGQLIVGSRGGLLADVMVFGYYTIKGRYRSQLLFLAGLALLTSFAFPTSTWGRFLKPDPSGGSGRVEIWKVGLAALKDHWLIGGGFGNFPQLYNKYFLTVFNQYYEHWSRAPHNIILQAWVEIGLIGLALMLWGWWATFKSMDHIPKGHALYDWRIAYEGGIGGTLFAAIFVGVMLYKFTWFSFTLTALFRQITKRRMAAEQAAYAQVEPSIVEIAAEEDLPPKPALPVTDAAT